MIGDDAERLRLARVIDVTCMSIKPGVTYSLRGRPSARLGRGDIRRDSSDSVRADRQVHGRVDVIAGQ